MSFRLPPVLVVDDETNMRRSLATMLSDEGYCVRDAESAEEALKLIGSEEFFLVLTDARLGGISGYEFLNRLKKAHSGLPVLMITAYATPKLAVEAIKAGAIDYLSKPFAPEELLHQVGRCAERYRLLQENASLRERASESYGLEHIIGESVNIKELRQMIRTVAPTDATVLILGESGTGKELVAGAMHSLSQRQNEHYIKINCAAIPESLLESELFGHEKGAFTGAMKQKHGRVEEADSGTIFLDEIADMSRPLQAKLLRFLEDGSFTRIGGMEEMRVNVRLIAATNRDIVKDIDEGAFREDLFHRLNVVQLRIPPLRERGDDVALLSEHFLKHFNLSLNKHLTGISHAALQQLLSHQWPGNVRELRNVIERASILETRGEIRPASLPDFQIESRLHKSESRVAPGDVPLDEAMADFERDFITTAMEKNRFNLTRTAEQLKISRHALRYRMQRLNITTSEDGEDNAGGPDGKEASV